MSARLSPSARLSTLELPFGGLTHPRTDDLRTYGRAWVQQVGLARSQADLERFDDAQYWQLIARAYPTVPWNMLTLAHNWNVWGFYLDDVDDAGEAAAHPETLKRLFAQILALLQDAPPSEDLPPFLRALQDVWGQMHRCSSSQWRSRFVQVLSESFSAYEWEARNRLAQRVPAVAEYMNYRRKTGGWMTDVLLVDLAEGHVLPESLFRDPSLQRLLDTANNIICWANDIFSFEKERAIHEVHNLVPVVQAAYQCTEAAAFEKIVVWHNRELQQWKRLVQKVPPWAGHDGRLVQAYIAFSEHFIHANHVWSQGTGRYRPRHLEGDATTPRKIWPLPRVPLSHIFCKGRSKRHDTAS